MYRLNRRVWRGPRASRGFTMVEIILVVVIIMTLVAVVAPRMVGRAKQAQINATRMSMHSVSQALLQFEIHAGRFPTGSEGLAALLEKPSGLSEDQWPDKYLDSTPKDAWGTELDYTYPSEHGRDFDLRSAGPDRQMNTDDDVISWEAEENKE